MSKHHFQIVVVGSGFAGSLMAMVAQRLGFSTALIERGKHPRFVIGESSTPLANLLLEEISREYDLPGVLPLCKWGSWQRKLPQIACGLKRGFTFYHHQLGKRFSTDAEGRNQLLVGASPNEEIADTHWYRPDFDHYLVKEAQALGVSYWEETLLSNAREEPNGMRIVGKRRDQPVEITADFVIDASGPRGFLHRALELTSKPFPNFQRTQALFSHFENVGSFSNNVSSSDRKIPYPPEQAAVHHIFPGGWIWILKFNNGITSAGVAATEAIADDLDFGSGEPAWQRLLEQLPSLGEIFESARPLRPFVHLPELAFRSGVISGSRWTLLPSAAGFVDPLLSTGFPLALLGVTRICQLLRLNWKHPNFKSELAAYATLTELELETTSRLVKALYKTMDRFDLFKHLSLLYFAAASYSETVRRLGKPGLAKGFLLCRHPAFSTQFRQICETASNSLSSADARNLKESIRRMIEPFDVAGLTDESRDPWYPAKTSDLLRNPAKVGANEGEIKLMLERYGLKQN